jgi:hypothetical protein
MRDQIRKVISIMPNIWNAVPLALIDEKSVIHLPRRKLLAQANARLVDAVEEAHCSEHQAP